MNSEWKAFIDTRPWFLRRGQAADAGETIREGGWSPATTDFASYFPRLHELLVRARVTPVRVGDQQYQLFSWLDGSRTRAWLAAVPTADAPSWLYPQHVVLLRSFGGIVERLEPMDSWLMNQNEVLTLREAAHDASFITAYARPFERAGTRIPIEPTEFYSISREANGNDTLCHRTSGRVILFAPDHGFDYVTPLAGCPEYTLYELNGAKHFVDWINVVAEQWLDGLA